jgi:hypothetical protein
MLIFHIEPPFAGQTPSISISHGESHKLGSIIECSEIEKTEAEESRYAEKRLPLDCETQAGPRTLLQNSPNVPVAKATCLFHLAALNL